MVAAAELPMPFVLAITAKKMKNKFSHEQIPIRATFFVKAIYADIFTCSGIGGGGGKSLIAFIC